MLTTESLRDDVLEIRKALRDGKMTNAVARTLLHGSKIALDTLRAEMDAARLGSHFGAVPLHESERTRDIRRVA